MMKSIILVVVTVAAVSALTDLQEFRRIVNKSRLDCRRDRSPKAPINRVCPGKRTLGDLYATIPNGELTVRQYAPADFRKTLEMCHSRQNGESSDWRSLRAARGRLRIAGSDDLWKKCDAQIKDEQKLVCALSQGTHYDCAPKDQLKRTSTTLENDQCFIFEAYVDGRPEDAAAFRRRLAEGRKDCRRSRDTDEIKTRCIGEKTVAETLRKLPPGINWKSYVVASSELGKLVNKCMRREETGWPQLRVHVNRVLRGGGANIQARRDCQDQLRKEQQECQKASKIMCAFTYGLDMSCVDENQRQDNLPEGACEAVLSAIEVENIRRA